MGGAARKDGAFLPVCSASTASSDLRVGGQKVGKRLRMDGMHDESVSRERIAQLEAMVSDLKGVNRKLALTLKGPLVAVCGLVSLAMMKHGDTMQPEVVDLLRRISVEAKGLARSLDDLTLFPSVAATDCEEQQASKDA